MVCFLHFGAWDNVVMLPSLFTFSECVGFFAEDFLILCILTQSVKKNIQLQCKSVFLALCICRLQGRE
ncbi:MAG: hypothetical protein FWH33_09865, partial [Oscillospiraceae bacterium]|nr:hypothetical protein [Oscillospiraceae bacterium]